MLKRVFLSRTGITFMTLGHGAFFGLQLGMLYYADQDRWALLGMLVFGAGLACGLIMLFQKSRWGDDGLLKLRRTRFNARWMSDGG